MAKEPRRMVYRLLMAVLYDVFSLSTVFLTCQMGECDFKRFSPLFNAI